MSRTERRKTIQQLSGDLNTPLKMTARRQKNKQGLGHLNNSNNHTDLTDISNALRLTTDYTFFPRLKKRPFVMP